MQIAIKIKMVTWIKCYNQNQDNLQINCYDDIIWYLVAKWINKIQNIRRAKAMRVWSWPKDVEYIKQFYEPINFFH